MSVLQQNRLQLYVHMLRKEDNDWVKSPFSAVRGGDTPFPNYFGISSFVHYKCFPFYCAMHYSANRGLAIACRPSVTLVYHDHIG